MIRILPVAALALLAGCNLVEPKACTLIGCEDSLTVSVSGLASGSATVEVRAPDATMTVQCEVRNGLCTAYFARFIPASATVTIRTATQTVTRNVGTITYTYTQPNGPKCNPVCRQATVNVSV